MITSSPEISYIGSDVCCFSSFYTPFLWCEQPSILLSISFILDLIRLFQAPSLHIRQCAIVTQKFDFSRIFFYYRRYPTHRGGSVCWTRSRIFNREPARTALIKMAGQKGKKPHTQPHPNKYIKEGRK